MARIVYIHPTLTQYQYHVYTNLDFWDARRILKDLAEVRRNFGKNVSGDEYPTQVVFDGLGKATIRQIEKRLRRAIPSPPRHVIVQEMVFNGFFDFDPVKYYPERWSRSRMIYFTHKRLPLDQSALSTPFQTAALSWVGNKIRVERVMREKPVHEVIMNRKDARRHLAVPSCF